MLTRLIESLLKAFWADVARQDEESKTPAEPQCALRMPAVPSETSDEDVFIIPAQPLYWNRIGDTTSGTGRNFRGNGGRPRENL